MKSNLCTILFCNVFLVLGLLLSFCFFQKDNSDYFKVFSHTITTINGHSYSTIIKLNSRTGETWISATDRKWRKITDEQSD